MRICNRDFQDGSTELYVRSQRPVFTNAREDRPIWHSRLRRKITPPRVRAISVVEPFSGSSRYQISEA
ncbi:hypothetical protein TNCV_3131691 [Trichonephila clavipes]|nr:hypothetical protein TNCV_3131691 [Trichonephila clavipes]